MIPESNHLSTIIIRFSPLQFQVPLLYVALVQIDSVLSFGASLFGNRFLYRAQHYTTKPKQAYRLRKPYQDKYGPYGDNLIHTVRFICLLKQATPRGMIYPKKIRITYTTYIHEWSWFSMKRKENQNQNQNQKVWFQSFPWEKDQK